MKTEREPQFFYDITYSLRPFQADAVKKMREFLENGPEHACYNATEQGLGKSIETLATIRSMPRIQRILIICPAIMCDTWKAEIEKWLPTYTPKIIRDKNLGWLGQEAYSIHLVSYNRATSLAAELAVQRYDMLVLDESHFVKTPKAQRTKMILGKIWPKIPYRICLSGTPATRSIADLYTTFHKILPDAFPNWKYFTERYTNPRWDGYQVRYEGIKNEKELSKIMRENFYLRDIKADVAKDLPPKIWSRISLPPELDITRTETPYEKEVHQNYVKQLLKAIISNKPAPAAPKPIATKRREQAMKKVKSVVEFTEDLLEKDLSVVVFAHHRDVIHALADSLKKHKPGIIMGDVANEDRQEVISNFRTGKTNLVICSMQAGGIGIDLTTASHAVFAELDYSPATISQAAARVHRLTTKLPVNLYYFIVMGSIEEEIFEKVVEKTETFAKVV